MMFGSWQYDLLCVLKQNFVSQNSSWKPGRKMFSCWNMMKHAHSYRIPVLVFVGIWDHPIIHVAFSTPSSGLGGLFALKFDTASNDRAYG